VKVVVQPRDLRQIRMRGSGSGIHDLGMASGWRMTGYVAVGGLTEVGFGRDARFLLIVSHQGRGVVDCLIGERVARDPDERPGWFDAPARQAEGIGPLAGQHIPVAGLAGGSLLTETADGWRVTAETDRVIVRSPQNRNPRDSFAVEESEELRAWGFAPDGMTLVVAASSGLVTYRRQNLDRRRRRLRSTSAGQAASPAGRGRCGWFRVREDLHSHAAVRVPSWLAYPMRCRQLADRADIPCRAPRNAPVGPALESVSPEVLAARGETADRVVGVPCVHSNAGPEPPRLPIPVPSADLRLVPRVVILHRRR